MASFTRLLGGFGALLRKRRVEQDLDDELRAFLATAVEQKMQTGMSPEEATRAARMELGSIEAVKDSCRPSETFGPSTEASVIRMCCWWMSMRAGLATRAPPSRPSIGTCSHARNACRA
jgi:hypothetical protein